MLACKRVAHRGLFHVQRFERLLGLGLLAGVLQLMAAGCVCNCTAKFETACAQARGRVVTTGSDLVGCVAPDGAVLATWSIDEDGGEP